MLRYFCSMIKSWIYKLARLEIALILLVILAGSIVRMTGSGMGCPDWPKCFGLLIPPTEQEQIEWKANHNYKQGQIIIYQEELKVASQDFTTGKVYRSSNWDPYVKHDYARFVPLQTWIEYINRLIGALAGVPMLLMVALSLMIIRSRPLLFVFSLAGLFLLGFEAWLGKLVVDGNLIPGSITIHMMGALAVLLTLLAMESYLRKLSLNVEKLPRQVPYVMVGVVLLSVVQIIFGTQVREQIDQMVQQELARIHWIENLNWKFKFHRSFSILVFLANAYLWHHNGRHHWGFWQFRWVMIIIVLEIITGIFMAYFYVPAPAQPIHLLFSALLFALQGHALFSYFWFRKMGSVRPAATNPKRKGKVSGMEPFV